MKFGGTRQREMGKIPALITREEHRTIVEYIEKKHQIIRNTGHIYYAVAAFFFGLSVGIGLMCYGVWLLNHATS
jgi:hypothetical protein